MIGAFRIGGTISGFFGCRGGGKDYTRLEVAWERNSKREKSKFYIVGPTNIFSFSFSIFFFIHKYISLSFSLVFFLVTE